jgi:two-component system, OmpR family, sensor histidine kinase KdpD
MGVVGSFDRRSALTGLLVSVAAVAVVTGVIYGLREIVPVVSTGVVYLLAVLLVSTYWGLWLGLLTALLSAAAFNFFHIPPTGEFTIADGEHWVALVIFTAAAALTSTLANSARARADEADQRRREADLTAEMARLLLGGASVDESLRSASQRVAQAFGLSSVSIELRWIDSDERRRAIPLLVDGDRAGSVVVPKDIPDETMEALRGRVVPALETLVAATRRRDELEAQVIETKALRRSNVVKTAVLRSVSHDLRSPLTAITAAAGGLGSKTLSDAEREELESVIALESDRLTRLVDNLLDLSRLQSGGAEPQPDWCSVEELVRAAIDSVPAPEAGFDVRLDADLPLIRADAGQLERALANVLENSSRFAAGEPVSIRASVTGRRLGIRISDRGPGIPAEDLERVFEPLHRAREDHDGSGLGLAIARGFVEANGGGLRAESLPGQGTTFVLQLPVPAEKPAADAPARASTT